MDGILNLFTFADREERAVTGPAQELHRGVGAVLATLAIGALWGASAGSMSAHLAAANLYKVPMVILLSALSALPAGMLTWRALVRGQSASYFLTAHAKSLFGAALVLGASAPLVALYSHTSASAGPIIAHVSVAAALVVGAATFVRAILRGATASERAPRIAAAAVCVVLQLAAALQLNVLAAPILPTPTAFSAGIDGFHGAKR